MRPTVARGFPIHCAIDTLAIALLLAGAALARVKKAPRQRPEPNTGRVTIVTAERAYLDKGSADGIAAGQTVELAHGKSRVACKIESVATRCSTCVAAVAQAGDRFAVRP